MDRWAAADALPAPIAHENALEAPTAPAFRRRPFHDPFHGPMASTAERITQSHRSAGTNRQALRGTGVPCMYGRPGADWPDATALPALIRQL